MSHRGQVSRLEDKIHAHQDARTWFSFSEKPMYTQGFLHINYHTSKMTHCQDRKLGAVEYRGLYGTSDLISRAFLHKFESKR